MSLKYYIMTMNLLMIVMVSKTAEMSIKQYQGSRSDGLITFNNLKGNSTQKIFFLI